MEMRRTDDVSLQSKGQDCLVFGVINISGSSEGRHDDCPFKGVRDPKLRVPFLSYERWSVQYHLAGPVCRAVGTGAVGSGTNANMPATTTAELGLYL